MKQTVYEYESQNVTNPNEMRYTTYSFSLNYYRLPLHFPCLRLLLRNNSKKLVASCEEI